jgi:hypothetical protein
MSKKTLFAVNLFAAFALASIWPAHALPGC